MSETLLLVVAVAVVVIAVAAVAVAADNSDDCPISQVINEPSDK